MIRVTHPSVPLYDGSAYTTHDKTDVRATMRRWAEQAAVRAEHVLQPPLREPTELINLRRWWE